MQDAYSQDETFDRIDFSQNPLIKGEYENCIFNSCNFADSNLNGFKFIECEFNGCNLSMAKLEKTTFQDIKFKDCKMLGLHFDSCNDFGLSFSVKNCQLNHSSFYKTKIKKTYFKDCQLLDVDFTECNLSSSLFENCILTGATFDYSNLEKVDFRTAANYSIDPENNKIRNAKFSISGIPGLLDKYDIEIEK